MTSTTTWQTCTDCGKELRGVTPNHHERGHRCFNCGQRHFKGTEVQGVKIMRDGTKTFLCNDGVYRSLKALREYRREGTR